MSRRAAALLLLALCACAGPRVNAPNSALTIVQQHEPRSLNPALENGQSATQWGFLLFSYLVKYDDRGHLAGDAAIEAPTPANGGITSDGRTITYHLRRGIRFADGARLTAHDCVWTIAAINNPSNNVQSRYGYDRIASAQAPDDYTLVLHLKRPSAPLPAIVLAPQSFPILPAHLLSRYRNFNAVDFDQHPIGSGPYVVTRWLHGDRIELRANTHYFAGKPRIDRLTVRFVPDTQTALTLLQTHEVQGYFDTPDLAQYQRLRQIPGYRATATPVAGVGSLIFNTADPELRDANVRHAVAEAIDIRGLVHKVYRGAVSARHAGRGLFLWAYDPDAYPDVPYRPLGARIILSPRHMSLTLAIRAGSTADAIAANTIAEYERAAGVRIEIKPYAVEQFAAPANQGGPIYGGRFQLALYNFVNGDDPDTTDQFACANVPPHGYNKTRLCDGRIDALLHQGTQTFDATSRKAIYRKLERLLYRQLPMVMLYGANQVNAFTSDLHGQTTSIDGAWWNVGRWSLHYHDSSASGIPRPRMSDELTQP